MRQYRFASLAAAILLCGAGAAYAADSGTMSNPGNKSTPSAGGAVKNAPGSESARDNATDQKLGQWAIGKTVYDREGDVVGTVKQVQGNKLVVTAGAELGIGARDIVLTSEQLNQSGSGADMRLITTLTKAELKAQPEAKGSMNGTGKMR